MGEDIWTKAVADDSTKREDAEALESWKSIANYLQRRVRTVQRWERDEGLPIHRHVHKKQATVYAYKHELDAWRVSREQQPTPKPRGDSRRLVLVALGVVGVAAAIWLLMDRYTGETTPERSMMVVLPFDNLGPDDSMRLLSDGLTEELSTQLAKVEPNTLGVIARTSAMSYRDRQVPIDVIRDELRVDYLLEGSIRREDKTVRVTAQLIEAERQSHVWADTFDLPLDTWLALQEQATERIVYAVANTLRLPGEFEIQFADRELVAYEHVLLGHRYFDDLTGSQAAKAIEHFERAIELDDDSVDAHIGLALGYGSLAFYGAMPVRLAYTNAREAATTALELDPNQWRSACGIGLGQIRLRLGLGWCKTGARARSRFAAQLTMGSLALWQLFERDGRTR